MPADPPLRRKWNITRWLVVLGLLGLGWSGWRVYAFRSALAEAKTLGWTLLYTDPVETVRKDWKAVFKKETWRNGEKWLFIQTGEMFEQHIAVVRELNPEQLQIENSAGLRDLSALERLPHLQEASLHECAALTNLRGCKSLPVVFLSDCKSLTTLETLPPDSALITLGLIRCTALTNVDGLRNLSALETVSLVGCTGLTNVDALKNLSALREVYLTGCTGLTPESVAELKAALPKAKIYRP
ncbi:MAG: hypothetical protein RL088_3 [Verrucomicrobiota bacterium]|jgi:hypothetical protein